MSTNDPNRRSVEDMDVTLLSELPDNYDGLDQVSTEDVSNGPNFAMTTTALRKNLTGAFDQFASVNNGPLNNADMIKHYHVKDKIEAFERATTTNKNISSSTFGGVHQESDTFENMKPHPPFSSHVARPPAVPVKSNINKKTTGTSSADPSLLHVYLRVRPPTKRLDIRGPSDDIVNTVEIIETTSNEPCTKIRTYPPSSSNAAKVVRGMNHSAVSMNAHNSTCNLDYTGMVKGVKEFEFSQVFSPFSSQQDIYDIVASPLVDGLFPSSQTVVNEPKKLVGHSALLFAYGITNAGKTYTMVGKFPQNSTQPASNNIENDPNAGIIPRSLSHILKNVASLNETTTHNILKLTSGNERFNTETDLQIPTKLSYQLFMSYFEIYNEQIFDLLPHEKKLRPGQFYEESLKIRETRSGRTYVGGLAKHPVKDVATGIELLRSAMNKRRTSSNSINHDSSRSHSICQFEIVAVTSHQSAKGGALLMDDDNASTVSDSIGYNTDDDHGTSSSTNPTRRSVNMWIVDLAGSERSKRTGFLPKASRQKESNLINSSLMKLMRCFQIIAENQKSSNASSSLVPFRESKLTHLFMAHLTGTPVSRTSMIVNINPMVDDFDETQHVLSYASNARNIRISEADYNRKRRAIQISLDEPRPTSSSQGTTAQGADNKRVIKSPSKKICRLVQKLSPRALLAKRKQEILVCVDTHNDKDKICSDVRQWSSTNSEVFSSNACLTSTSRLVVNEPSHDCKLKKDIPKCVDVHCIAMRKTLLDEKEALRLQLLETNELMEQHQLEKNKLLQKLNDCESKVRMEIAEETEAQIVYLREQHNEIVNRLRHQYQLTSTPSKSAINAHSDKAAQMIVEYMEKIDECEEEMERMHNAHDSEILQLKARCKQELEAKDSIIVELELKLLTVETEKREAITQLEQSLSNKKEEIIRLRKENEALAASPYFESSHQSSDHTEAIYDEDDQVVHDKENFRDGSFRSVTSPSTPGGVRRLPRPRCSEVACSNISPNSTMAETNLKQSSSTKKRQGLISTLTKSKEMRSPFKQPSSRKSEYTDSLVCEEEIMYPLSQPEFDEISGRYQRPRGRAPMGRTWDFQVGGWRRM